MAPLATETFQEESAKAEAEKRTKLRKKTKVEAPKDFELFDDLNEQIKGLLENNEPSEDETAEGQRRAQVEGSYHKAKTRGFELLERFKKKLNKRIEELLNGRDEDELDPTETEQLKELKEKLEQIEGTLDYAIKRAQFIQKEEKKPAPAETSEIGAEVIERETVREKVVQRRWREAIEHVFATLNNDERAKLMAEINQRRKNGEFKGQSNDEAAIILLNREYIDLWGKFNEKLRKAGVQGGGEQVSRETFAKMIRDGLVPEDMKCAGFFGRYKIEIPNEDESKDPTVVTHDEFMRMVKSAYRSVERETDQEMEAVTAKKRGKDTKSAERRLEISQAQESLRQYYFEVQKFELLIGLMEGLSDDDLAEKGKRSRSRISEVEQELDLMREKLAKMRERIEEKKQEIEELKTAKPEEEPEEVPEPDVVRWKKLAGYAFDRLPKEERKKYIDDNGGTAGAVAKYYEVLEGKRNEFNRTLRKNKLAPITQDQFFDMASRGELIEDLSYGGLIVGRIKFTVDGESRSMSPKDFEFEMNKIAVRMNREKNTEGLDIKLDNEGIMEHDSRELKESYGKIYQRIKNNLETVAKDGVTLQEIIDKVENIRTLLWEESGKKEVKKKKGEKPRWALLHPKFDIKSLIELFKDKNDPVLKKIVFALQEEKRIIRAAMKDGTVGDYRDRVKGFISPKQENLEENDGSEKPEPIKESKKEPETPKEETPPRKK